MPSAASRARSAAEPPSQWWGSPDQERRLSFEPFLDYKRPLEAPFSTTDWTSRRCGGLPVDGFAQRRSEERRVGKECRAGRAGAPNEKKNKTQKMEPALRIRRY